MQRSDAKSRQFSRLLMNWNRELNTRSMPWKGEKDPYKIWLSEIILQQTRVEQGTSYYNRMLKAFPDINAMAAANENKIFKLWEGLGYYSRCRNLLATAQYISRENKGRFPDTYESILALKGVGPYTAAAISSFAYNLPYPVVDGNVYRVLSRIFGIYTPVDGTAGKKQFNQLAHDCMDKNEPALYNQAIMDFGAMICKPVPLCEKCPLKKICFAFRQNEVSNLPVKRKSPAPKKRWFYYLVLEYKGSIAIRQRLNKDIWQNLYEYPLLETRKQISAEEIFREAEVQKILPKNKYSTIFISPVFKQQLSHQVISGRFIKVKLKTKPVNHRDWLWLPSNKISAYPFPKFINMFRDLLNSDLSQ